MIELLEGLCFVILGPNLFVTLLVTLLGMILTSLAVLGSCLYLADNLNFFLDFMKHEKDETDVFMLCEKPQDI